MRVRLQQDNERIARELMLDDAEGIMGDNDVTRYLGFPNAGGVRIRDLIHTQHLGEGRKEEQDGKDKDGDLQASDRVEKDTYKSAPDVDE
mmetsp:Transcript_136/g.147  ORF Transcript_136/g.147 Transcript_136/m.147 type:complete len:90 (+) Transcript_136:331-600(+)